MKLRYDGLPSNCAFKFNLRRFIEATLHELSSAFGEHLFGAIPKIWELLAGPLLAPAAAPAPPQAVVDGLQVLKVLGPAVHEALQPR